MDPNPLIVPGDVAVILDSPASSPRLQAACDDAYFAICAYVRFDVGTLLADSWQRGAVIMVGKRIAARFFKNPLEAQNVTIQQGQSNWMGPTVGPRMLTSDEKDALAFLRQDVLGSFDLAGPDAELVVDFSFG